MNIMNFISRSRMILYKVTKPKDSEYWRTARITFIGMIFIGILGLLVYLVFLGINEAFKYITG